MNWKFPTPLFVCVNCGLRSRFNPVHCEVTPSNVTLVLLTELAPVGTNGPSADTFVPVTEYCQASIIVHRIYGLSCGTGGRSSRSH